MIEVFKWLIVSVVFVMLVNGGCVVIGNRFEKQKFSELVELPLESQNLPEVGDRISVTTWNIGYAGMGEESDFFYDGGKQRRPLTRLLVEKNLSGIQQFLRDDESSVVFLQEVAKPSWITYGRDVLKAVRASTGVAFTMFNADIVTRGVPLPIRVEVGNLVGFSNAPTDFELVGLPLEPYFEYGLFRKNYRLHVLRMKGSAKWTLVNLHLSAFDPEEIDVRRQQVEAVLRFASSEYSKGRRVIIGGDWNLILSSAGFPHTTDKKHSFWVRSFPQELLPENWKIVADPEVPTVRLAHQPYVHGENRTIAIDGFVVSPNVEVVSITAHNLEFQWSDHNPVSAVFSAN